MKMTFYFSLNDQRIHQHGSAGKCWAGGGGRSYLWRAEAPWFWSSQLCTGSAASASRVTWKSGLWCFRVDRARLETLISTH